jgi:hypothetical protein
VSSIASASLGGSAFRFVMITGLANYIRGHDVRGGGSVNGLSQNLGRERIKLLAVPRRTSPLQTHTKF